MADDLESFVVRSISHLDREGMIRALALKGDEAEVAARSARSKARRAKSGMRKDREQSRYEAQKELMERIGRILFFLRCQLRARGTPENDWDLCLHLVEQLRAKGKWPPA